MALGGYTALFAIKLATFLATGIGVMYAEALHSLADMLVSGFLLIAALWSRKPADQNYRYGYGRAQNVAALVAATIFISFTALEAFREAISKLLSNAGTEYSNLTLGITVIAVAIVISALPLINIWRSKQTGAASRAQFTESINDEIALFAALIGIVLIAQGIAIADGIASLIVAGVIAFNAGGLWWQNAQNLIGRSPEKDFYRLVEETAKSVKGVMDVHDMRAELIGGQIHLEMHITVTRGMTVEEADRISEQVEEEVGKIADHAYCTIHVEAAESEQTEGGERKMTEKMPTEMLEAEHRFIAKVVGAAAVLADQLEAGQEVEPATFLKVVEFMRVYADRCHHGKEEELLFPALAKKGVPMRGCPVEALTREHAMGRALVKGLAEAADAYQKADTSAKEALIKNLRGIADLYPNHIWKEDYLLFPLSNKVLTPDDRESLYAEFEKVEERIGRDVHHRLEQQSEELAR